MNNIARIPKVIIFHFMMHRSNPPVHSISLNNWWTVFYDDNPRVLKTSHRSGAETLFAIVQVQYEEHALHTDSIEFSNSVLYSTADTRYACFPSPHICGPPVLSNYKKSYDQCYHHIPINVHYFFIVNKDIYF
jgi:hypothetical protein